MSTKIGAKWGTHADQWNHYRLLPDASDDAIKAQYRKLALMYHPDKAPGNEEKFKNISKAYKVLSDPESKEQYDKLGSVVIHAVNPMDGKIEVSPETIRKEWGILVLLLIAVFSIDFLLAINTSWQASFARSRLPLRVLGFGISVYSMYHFKVNYVTITFLLLCSTLLCILFPGSWIATLSIVSFCSVGAGVQNRDTVQIDKSVICILLFSGLGLLLQPEPTHYLAFFGSHVICSSVYLGYRAYYIFEQRMKVLYVVKISASPLLIHKVQPSFILDHHAFIWPLALSTLLAPFFFWNSVLNSNLSPSGYEFHLEWVGPFALWILICGELTLSFDLKKLGIVLGSVIGISILSDYLFPTWAPGLIIFGFQTSVQLLWHKFTKSKNLQQHAKTKAVQAFYLLGLSLSIYIDFAYNQEKLSAAIFGIPVKNPETPTQNTTHSKKSKGSKSTQTPLGDTKPLPGGHGLFRWLNSNFFGFAAFIILLAIYLEYVKLEWPQYKKMYKRTQEWFALESVADKDGSKKQSGASPLTGLWAPASNVRLPSDKSGKPLPKSDPNYKSSREAKREAQREALAEAKREKAMICT